MQPVSIFRAALPMDRVCAAGYGGRRRSVFGPSTELFDVADTFCVNSAGRCVEPIEEMGEAGY
jgi:hypothetical protein